MAGRTAVDAARDLFVTAVRTTVELWAENERLHAERDEALAALREAWSLFGEEDTIEQEHLRPDDHFDRWCIRVKSLLGIEGER